MSELIGQFYTHINNNSISMYGTHLQKPLNTFHRSDLTRRPKHNWCIQSISDEIMLC